MDFEANNKFSQMTPSEIEATLIYVTAHFELINSVLQSTVYSDEAKDVYPYQEQVDQYISVMKFLSGISSKLCCHNRDSFEDVFDAFGNVPELTYQQFLEVLSVSCLLLI